MARFVVVVTVVASAVVVALVVVSVSVVVVIVAAVVCQTLRLLPVTLDFYLWVTLQLGSRSRRWPSKYVCVL